MNHDATAIPRFRPGFWGIVLLVSIIAVGGIAMVAQFARLDYERDMRAWQDRLNLIADSRAHEVSRWVASHFEEMKKLSENPSLQIYFTEIKTMPGPEESLSDVQEPPQKAYLRNLLIFSADRLGFAPPSVPMSMQIPAQIPFKSTSGLAVLDNENRVVVSTPYLASLSDDLRARLQQLPAGTQTLLDMQKDAEGHTLIGFVMPVFGIQADPASSEPAGRIIGLKQVDDRLFSLLKHPGVTEKTLEISLVRKEGGNIVYLSPLMDGSAPLEKALQDNPGQLAASFAAASPGEFGIRRDYASIDSLATGRMIIDTPWTLMVKISKKEALESSTLRRNGMVALFLALLGLFVAMIVAVWYVTSSRRAKEASRYFKSLAENLDAQKRLIKVVTDNQPEGVALLDAERRYRFANKMAAREAGMQMEDMVGKTITDVLGAARAKPAMEASEVAMTEKREEVRVLRRNENGQERIMRSQFIPLDTLPLPDMQQPAPGVLLVEQDISEVVHERESRIKAHQQLIDTLVLMVDKRDPHAANHSLLVSQIAESVAVAMDLSAVERETARVAGLLMNIGKIVVPEQLLTKRDSLSEAEKRNIRDSISASAELVKNIAFDGQVYETLKESLEHWDGSGPLGLKEEGILITARIIVVSNAFVGMISPRSYRAAFTVDAAAKLLLDKAGEQYDRKVVIALVNFIENQGGREMLMHWTHNRGAA